MPSTAISTRLTACGTSLAGVARLLGHVRDGLDPGVGDHRDREREDQLREARRHAEVDLVDQHRRVEDQHRAEHDQRDLGARGRASARKMFSLADSPSPRMLSSGEQRDHRDAADDVPGRVAQRREERAEVVRHEEGADRDREDVVERQRPAGEERDDLVEGVAGEGGGAARLGEHRRALGVGLRGEGEQAAGEDEDHRRQAQRVGGDQAERVVDRGADVAVGGGEQPRDADRLCAALVSSAGPYGGQRFRPAARQARAKDRRAGRKDSAKAPAGGARAGSRRRAR